MDVIIRNNKDGKRFQLIKFGRATAPTSEHQILLNKQDLNRFLQNSTPEKPETWHGIWSRLHDRPASASTLAQNSDHIKQLITDLAHTRRLHILPEGVNNPSLRVSDLDNIEAICGSNRTGSVGTSRSSSATSGLAKVSAPTSTPSIGDVKTMVSTDPTEDGEQSSENTVDRGEPVSMISGEEILKLTDGTLPGPIPWAWQRTYRSSRSTDIGLGYGWHFSGSEHLRLDGNNVIYIDQEGRRIPFALPENQQRSQYLPENLILDRIGENAFLLRGDGPWTKVFTRAHIRSELLLLSEVRHASFQPESYVHGARQGERGYTLRLHYNQRNQLAKAEGNWGKSYLFTYDQSHRITAVHLRNEYNGSNKLQATYQYSDQGDLVAQKNVLGIGEDYRYENHLITKRTLKTGFSFYFEWDGEDHTARCIRNYGDKGIYECLFEWDPDHASSQVTDSRGYTEQFNYNQYGQIIRHIDNEGNLHRYQYLDGRKQQYIDPLGNTTEYLYDQKNNPAGICDALGNRVILGYFNGQVTSFTDKDKSQWRREYNAFGQVTAAIDPYGQITRYHYNRHGLITQVVDPLNRSTGYSWSEEGDLIAVKDHDGHSRHLRYDEWGQCISSELKLRNGLSAGTVSFTYTETGQVASVTSANGDTSNYDYNESDQLIRHSDGQGRTTEFKYDGLSQIIERINPEGHSLKYQYDSERNLIALINEKGEKSQFYYDGNERLVKEIGFDGRAQHYKYNAAGHLIKHLDSGEVIHAFERDALGQMLTKTSRSLLDRHAQTEMVRFSYDPKGRLLETYNQHQFLSFEYNVFGNLTKEYSCDLNSKRQRILSSAKEIIFSNVWPGKRSGFSLPDGQMVHYELDIHNRLAGIQLNQQEITRIERDFLGREIAREQGDLVTVSEYDPAGRLKKQQAFNQTQKTDGLIQREYQYDSFGNLSSLHENQQETRYCYDLLNRLKRAEGSLQETFEFDPANNLLDSGSTDHHAGGNRLAMQGDRKHQYDRRGNLIQENRGQGGTLYGQYRYNVHNQLVELNKDGQVIRYRYDSLGRRIAKSDSFGTTRYLWVADQMVQETRKALKKTYIYEPENFRPVALVQDGEVYHYHLDHLGTPKEITNQNGRIVWQARYKSYGNLANLAVCDIENNLRFQGQYFDQESGLHYNRHRYFNPSSGQFISQDPIGLLGGVNNYQYAPNPVGWVDPFGLRCKENVWSAFRTDMKGHFPDITTAVESFQKMKAIQAMAKVDWPEPSTYLPQSYIDAQDAKFAGGALRFMTKTNIDKYGRGQGYDASVVIPSRETDSLGLPRKMLEGNELIKADFVNPDGLGFRTPFDFERGVHELWFEGGKLPDGRSGAVIDIGDVPSSRYSSKNIKD